MTHQDEPTTGFQVGDLDEKIELQVLVVGSVAKPFKRAKMVEMSLDPSGIMQHWHTERVKQILKKRCQAGKSQSRSQLHTQPSAKQHHGRQTQPASFHSLDNTKTVSSRDTEPNRSAPSQNSEIETMGHK